jgi:hypothetical protein
MGWASGPFSGSAAHWRSTPSSRHCARDMEVIERELSSREAHPGHSVPQSRVDEAVREVIKAHPSHQRLCEDYAIARRSFETYSPTLIFLRPAG